MSNLNLTVTSENGKLQVYAQSKYYDQKAYTAGIPEGKFSESLDLKLDHNLRSICLSDDSDSAFSSAVSIEEIGSLLFDLLFSGRILWLYRFHLLNNPRNALRLNFLKAPHLTNYPWEMLYDKEEDLFLGLSNKFSIIRYLPASLIEGRSHSKKKSLRILFIVSCEPELNVEAEWSKVNSVFQRAIDGGELVLERLSTVDYKSLQSSINAFNPNIVHFIGHSRYDAAEQVGHIQLTNAQGHVEKISADSLGYLLGDCKDLSLLVLNSCESSITSPQLIYSGLSQRLIQAGVPIIISMQRNINDDSAILFSDRFYLSLSNSLPVETAVTESRKSLREAKNLKQDWYVPTLYSRSDESILFVFSDTYSYKEFYAKYKSKVILFFLSFGLLLIPVTHVLVNSLYKQTTITIYDENHKPIPDVTVKITRLNLYEQTNAHGKLTIRLFNKKRPFKVTIVKEGYDLVSSTLVPGTPMNERIYKKN